MEWEKYGKWMMVEEQTREAEVEGKKGQVEVLAWRRRKWEKRENTLLATCSAQVPGLLWEENFSFYENMKGRNMVARIDFFFYWFQRVKQTINLTYCQESICCLDYLVHHWQRTVNHLWQKYRQYCPIIMFWTVFKTGRSGFPF